MLEQLQFKALELAQNAGALGTNGVPDVLRRNTDLNIVIKNVINWSLGIAGGLAVLVLVIGGVMYVTAAGDQTRIELAKKTIKGAIIGIIVILISAVIVYAVASLIG